MTAATGANGSARANGSAKGPADAGASALDRPWTHVPAAADLGDVDDATIEANLRLASGGAAPVLAWQTLSDLAAASGVAGPAGADGSDGADAAAGGTAGGLPVFAAVEAALALAPRDPLEGMLAAQMAAVHAAAMRCLVRAAECTKYPKIEALYLRQAARLLNLFVRQAEALDRRTRRFGRPAEQGQGPVPGNAAPQGVAEPRDPLADPRGTAERCERIGAIFARRAAELRAEAAAQGASETDAESGQDPDGGKILDHVLADPYAHMRAREQAEGDGEAQDASGDGGEEAGSDGGLGPRRRVS